MVCYHSYLISLIVIEFEQVCQEHGDFPRALLVHVSDASYALYETLMKERGRGGKRRSEGGGNVRRGGREER
jgi:hypothetical protein